MRRFLDLKIGDLDVKRLKKENTFFACPPRMFFGPRGVIPQRLKKSTEGSHFYPRTQLLHVIKEETLHAMEGANA